MKVKAGIVTSTSTGKLVGFCDQGNLNEELKNLSKVITDNNSRSEPELATHILVFMVRGLMAKFNLPFMWYPCCVLFVRAFLGSCLESPRILEDLGLQVYAWVCDGASPNRQFFRIHKNVGGQYKGHTYFTINRYDRSRKIYFICDAPHLLKTSRNNFEKSHGHNNTKEIVYQGRSIKWPHIISTVEEDKRRQLSRLPKIREEHINLSPQMRMTVWHIDYYINEESIIVLNCIV